VGRGKIFWQAYLGAGAFVVVIWYLLQSWVVKENQAYAIPFGLWLIGIGWSERRGGESARISR